MCTGLLVGETATRSRLAKMVAKEEEDAETINHALSNKRRLSFSKMLHGGGGGNEPLTEHQRNQLLLKHFFGFIAFCSLCGFALSSMELPLVHDPVRKMIPTEPASFAPLHLSDVTLCV